MRIAKAWTGSFKILFALLLLYLVFQSVDLSKIARNLKILKLESLIPLLAICWIGQLVCSERWRIFSASLQMKGSYRSFVQMYFAGMFFNLGLPSLVGGDIIKAYVVSRKSDRPLQIGLASVIQDRAAGLISLLAYGSVAILLHPMSWRGFPLWAAYALSWIAVAVFFWLTAEPKRIHSRFFISQNRTILRRMLQAIADLRQALDFRRLSRGAAIRIVLYSFLYSGLLLFAFWRVTFAAGRPVELVPFFALVPLVTIATMLPVTPSGLGVRELSYVEALSLAGVPRDQGLVISLAISALLVVCNLGGLVFLPGIPKEMRKQAQSVSQK